MTNIKEKIIQELDELKENQLFELDNYLKYLLFREKVINNEDSNLNNELKLWQQIGIDTLNNTLEGIENGSW